ncbi:acyl carrier protein [Roseobacter sp. YSTF-M11]|uniref:Acyl carrier protein n=1 Tax=Roseobacter insulae TaxID=2859783 RepID=A0A9X1FRE8_9RHOB|nr:acyl carrier protein [Roseobacter insulae]MBW4706207.1 acyl carrier protein [Roseobacter insulae]
MTHADAETALREELHRIAPDIDVAQIDADADLREEFDIDSMDFLTLVTALSKRLEIEMPDADYPRMQSFNALVLYLAGKSGQ